MCNNKMIKLVSNTTLLSRQWKNVYSKNNFLHKID